jgi:hypothetical protein
MFNGYLHPGVDQPLIVYSGPCSFENIFYRLLWDVGVYRVGILAEFSEQFFKEV